jgi:transcriptional regulator with XRE-family HTH domain
MDNLPSGVRLMHNSVELFVRQRAKSHGFSLSELCRRAGVSRQTLYQLGQVPARLPTLETVIALADVLEVHPLHLLRLIFDEVPLRAQVRACDAVDRSGFLRDVTYPDGSPVAPGERILKTWEIQNLGILPWEGRYLACQDDEVLLRDAQGGTWNPAPLLHAEERRVPVPRTEPGEIVRLSVCLTAPAVPGTVLSYWKMVFADGSLCFPDARGLWAKLRVITPCKAAQAKVGRQGARRSQKL